MSEAPSARVDHKLAELSRNLVGKTTVSSRIEDVLRGLILSGDLGPGARIVESRIAKQLGVGQPTVREALVALEHQGLVVRKTNQGCEVTSLTNAEISDILRIRRELEMMAAELAIDHATDEQLRELIDHSDRMKQAAFENNLQAFCLEDLRFHETLWRISGNTFLPKLLGPAMLPLLAFLFIRQGSAIDLAASAAAHEEIAEALLTRDKAHALEVTAEKMKMFSNQHLNLLGVEPF